jgi:DNA-binding NarL/FixJ family response regulator
MRIYIVDQNEKLVQSVNECLNANVIDDPVKALTILTTGDADIVFLNYDLLQKESPVFIRGLVQHNPELAIIVVGAGVSDAEIIECIMAGAKGYEELRGLADCASKLVKVIGLGEAWLSRRLVAQLIAYASRIKKS